jgi:hypothetical protein
LSPFEEGLTVRWLITGSLLLAGCSAVRPVEAPPRDDGHCLRVDQYASKHHAMRVSRDGVAISEDDFRAQAFSFAPSAAVLREVDEHRLRYKVGAIALGVGFLSAWAVGISGACDHGDNCIIGVASAMGAAFVGLWAWAFGYGTDRTGEDRVAAAFNAGSGGCQAGSAAALPTQ